MLLCLLPWVHESSANFASWPGGKSDYFILYGVSVNSLRYHLTYPNSPQHLIFPGYP